MNPVLSLKPCLPPEQTGFISNVQRGLGFSAFAPFCPDFYVFRQTRREIDGSPTPLNCHKSLHKVP